MAESDSDLIVQISATTELLRSQLTRADAEISRFQSQTNKRLDRVDRDFDRVGKSVGKLDGIFASFAAGAITGIASAFSVDAIIGFTSRALEAGSALSEMSEQLGVSVTELQEFTFLGEQAGISAEEMQKALQKLNRTIGEAAAGNKKAAGAFKELGVELRTADGSLKSPAQALVEIAGGLEKIPDPATRARLEVALFGKAGQNLAPLLNQGAAGISNLRAEYQKLGIALSDDQAKRLDDAADAWAKFKTQLEGKFTIWLAEEGLPELQAMLKGTQRDFDNIAAGYKRFKQFIGLETAPADRKAVRGGSNSGADGRPAGNNAAFGANPFTPRGPLSKSLLMSNFTGQVSANDQFQLLLSSLDFGAGRPTYGRTARPSDKTTGLAGIDDLVASAFDQLDERIGNFSSVVSDNIGIAADEYGRIVDELNAASDVTFQSVQDEADLREARIRDQAYLYEELMMNGTKGFLRTLESEGIRIIAEMVARLVSGQSLSNAFKVAAGNSTIGSVLGLASSFGGFFANGGKPPMSKVSVVGERGPELFVPRVPGTIIPNGGWGGGQSVSLTVNAPGATAETVAMIRRELAAAAPQIVAAASQSTVKALTRPRIG